VLRKLIEENKIEKDERIVCYVTGNGLKATEAVIGLLPKLNVIKPDTTEVSAIIRG
jgi:threonine synthase